MLSHRCLFVVALWGSIFLLSGHKQIQVPQMREVGTAYFAAFYTAQFIVDLWGPLLFTKTRLHRVTAQMWNSSDLQTNFHFMHLLWIIKLCTSDCYFCSILHSFDWWGPLLFTKTWLHSYMSSQNHDVGVMYFRLCILPYFRLPDTSSVFGDPCFSQRPDF